MKLAFCLFKYFPFGGLERDFLRIAKECVRRGHQVDVFTMRWEGELEPELKIHIIPVSGLQNHTRCQHFVENLQIYLAKDKYDLVIGFNKMPGLDFYYAADICYQAKTRMQYGAWYRLMPHYRHLVSFENAVFARTVKTQILLLSEAQQTEFSYYYQTQRERFYLLPPGIAKDRTPSPNAADIRCQTREELNIAKDEFLLLMIGSGFKTKGLDRILLGYAALLPELRTRCYVYVIGKDKATVFIRQAKRLNIAKRINFLGGRDDVQRFLLAADLLLHPAYSENTGTVLLEALVAGLPVLTTDVCGYARYVQEAKAGMVLASPFQQIQFNQSLTDMLLSAERSHWQKNALAFAKHADIYSMPERAVNIIEQGR